MLPTWINVYEYSRHYGGPEEGGWWYDSWECLASYGPFQDPVQLDNTLGWVEDKFELGPRGHGRYPVLNGTGVAVRTENAPGSNGNNWAQWS